VVQVAERDQWSLVRFVGLTEVFSKKNPRYKG
jgi:hypothetical protein